MNVLPADLRRQYATIKAEIDDRARNVFETQYFILGPEGDKLEQALAAHCAAKHALETRGYAGKLPALQADALSFPRKCLNLIRIYGMDHLGSQTPAGFVSDQ